MKPTALITCGALGREVVQIVQKYGWDVDVVGISASDHLHPERIAPDVEKRLIELRQQYERIIVVFGDCGSMGALDQVLEQHGIERLSGLNCYEWFSGIPFQDLLADEPGTFILTDYLVRGFKGAVIKGLGLDRYPDLKSVYFGNYIRALYLAQMPTPDLLGKAQRIADFLELPLEVRETGWGQLETQLATLMEQTPG